MIAVPQRSAWARVVESTVTLTEVEDSREVSFIRVDVPVPEVAHRLAITYGELRLSSSALPPGVEVELWQSDNIDRLPWEREHATPVSLWVLDPEEGGVRAWRPTQVSRAKLICHLAGD